jgi:hypothetical protein
LKHICLVVAVAVAAVRSMVQAVVVAAVDQLLLR